MIHLDHRPTQGALTYTLFNGGERIEWLDASHADPAVWSDAFGDGDWGDRDVEDSDVEDGEDPFSVDLPLPPRGASKRHPWNLEAIDDPQAFLDATLRAQGAYAPSWGRRHGEIHHLEIAGLEAEDFERMDFIAL